MDVEMDEPTTDINQIIQHLTRNPSISFKSQQRGEQDLTDEQKTKIALDLFQRNKVEFLVKFGKYLAKTHLEFFQQLTDSDQNTIRAIAKDLLESLAKWENTKKNRRYEALMQMIAAEDDYFTEIEMMKRNPLLYEQLIGQFLSPEEKTARCRVQVDGNSTLVNVLLEGIDRNNAQTRMEEQEQTENSEESDEGDEPRFYSQWGEFTEDTKKLKFEKDKAPSVSREEQEMLREEFVSFMHHSFLAGKDEDFDYGAVDNDERFDNSRVRGCDEEDRYFDSEEPEECQVEAVESEDELDIYMSALNQSPAVGKLARSIADL